MVFTFDPFDLHNTYVDNLTFDDKVRSYAE